MEEGGNHCMVNLHCKEKEKRVAKKNCKKEVGCKRWYDCLNSYIS
jgi:hypothetical protein